MASPSVDPLPILGCNRVDRRDGTCRHPMTTSGECTVFACPRISPAVKRVAVLSHRILREGLEDELAHDLHEAVNDLGDR